MTMNLQRQCAEVEAMVPQMRMGGRGGQAVTGGGGGGGATDEKGANGFGRIGNNVGSTQCNSNREQAGIDHGLR